MIGITPTASIKAEGQAIDLICCGRGLAVSADAKVTVPTQVPGIRPVNLSNLISITSLRKTGNITMATKRAQASWSDVKVKLMDFDRAGLIGLVQDMYSASKDNQVFLHARFALGDDVLKPYKVSIDRWLWPDPFKNQDTSVAKAKKAISDYKKAIGKAEGLAELMVFYCERAAGFCNDVGLQNESYFDALVRMYEQALKAIGNLPEPLRVSLRSRLEAVQQICRSIGYGVSDEMSDLLTTFDPHA